MIFGFIAASYLLIGAMFAIGANGANITGRALGALLWPYVLIADGTPSIRWLTHISGQERVIEETTALSGSIIQTVKQWGGYEYTRVKL